MMIVVDASVLIAQSRGRDRKLLSLFRTLPLATAGIARAELYTGARHPQQKASLVAMVQAFTTLPITEADWDFVGDVRGYFEGYGYSFNIPDVAIACVAMINGLELWSRDNHHLTMQTLMPQLRLFQEPP
jgi:predicted nucleic acid-binding protein